MRKIVRARTFVTLATIIMIAFSSGFIVETAIIFGSFYLLRSQAGGIRTKNILVGGVALAVMWTACMLFRSLVCPHWLLLLSAVLINVTIFLFAPATNEAKPEMDVEARGHRKNRAFFVAGVLCIFCIVTRGLPVSTLVLTAMLMETGTVWLVLLLALIQEAEDR